MNGKLKNRTRPLMIAALTVVAFIVPDLAGRGEQTPADRLGPFQRVSSLFERQVSALGRRGRENGKELSVYSGEFVDAISGQRSPVQVSYQLPGLVRLEGFPPGKRVVSFDGDRAAGVVMRTDEILLEMFGMDTVEGMLSSIQTTAAVRFLGARFAPDPKLVSNYTGPRFDVYEVSAPIVSRRDRLVRLKVYYFDSDTGLLQRTSYQDQTVSPSLEVELRFSGWRMIDGSPYPDRIDRFEGGRLVFSFTIASVIAAPKVDAARFR